MAPKHIHYIKEKQFSIYFQYVFVLVDVCNKMIKYVVKYKQFDSEFFT